MRRPQPVPYRRKREQKTNYKKRIKLLLSKKPRLVIRVTNRKIIAQLIVWGEHGDTVLAGVDSSSLRAMGWPYSCKNLPAAYLTGRMMGKKAKQQNVPEAILDAGFRGDIKKGRLYAVVKGVLDEGITIPVGESILPSEERTAGSHIRQWAELSSQRPGGHQQRFSHYLKNKQPPQNVVETFHKLKEKLGATK